MDVLTGRDLAAEAVTTLRGLSSGVLQLSARLWILVVSAQRNVNDSQHKYPNAEHRFETNHRHSKRAQIIIGL